MRLLAVGLLAGCVAQPVPTCSDGAISRLYFGLDTPVGEVTSEQWDTFVSDAVTPRFPDGFTVIEGRGQWRTAHGDLVTEHTRIVEFLHDGTARQAARVRLVADDYKRSFSQQSVLVTQGPSRFCF